MHKNWKRKINQRLCAKLQVGRFRLVWFSHIQCLTQSFPMADGKKVYYFINLGFVLSRLKIMSVNGQIRLVPIKQG